MGQPALAAKIHFDNGRYTTALTTLLRRTGTIQSDVQEQYVQYLLTGLWRFLPLGVEFSDGLSYEARFLLQLTGKVMQDCHSMTEHERAQVCCGRKLLMIIDYLTTSQLEMFQALENCDRRRLHDLAQKFYNDYEDKASAVLCLDRIFQQIPDLGATRILTEISSVLQAFLVYTEALEGVTRVQDSCTKRSIQRLFGFTNSAENVVTVFSGTSLLRRALKGSLSSNISISGTRLEQKLQQIIKHRLQSRVQEENEKCRVCLPLFPCAVFAINGQCPWNNRCRKSHNLHDAFSLQAYKLRLRILMQQILIFHTVESLVSKYECTDQRRYVTFPVWYPQTRICTFV